MVTINDPGIYPDIPHNDYLRDPVPAGSLSSSGARDMLIAPAVYQWRKSQPIGPTGPMDRGTIVHTLLLGSGPGMKVIDADSWRTKAAQEARDEARAAGAVPVLEKDAQPIRDMVAAVQRHPTAAPLLAQDGIPEATMAGVDPVTGEWIRARPDLLPVGARGRPILVDIKTARDASPDGFTRAVATHGYHHQHAWYVDLYQALTGVEPALVFVTVEPEPPYLVAVHQLDGEAVEAGRDGNRTALNRWHACRLTDTWPGYGTDVHQIHLPPWIIRKDYNT